jgi:hypothetical protein
MNISRRSLFAAPAISLVPISLSLDHYPQEGSEVGRVKWFNKENRTAVLKGCSSGHDILVRAPVFKSMGMERMYSDELYIVNWKLDAKRDCVCLDIRVA